MAMKFFYDSLDTVRKLKRPTKKDYIRLTLAIFAAVIIGGFIFIALDTLFSNGYQIFYHVMTPTT